MDLPHALEIRDWYAVAALSLLLLTQALRKVPRLRALVWERVPDGWRWTVPVLAGAVAGFVDAWQRGEPWGAAGLAALAGALGIGVPAMGAHALLRESPLPWDGRAGGKARAAKKAEPREPRNTPTDIGPAAIVLLCLGLNACAGSLETVRASRPGTLGASPASRDDVRCSELDDRRQLWSGVAQGAAVLAGGSGLATIPVDETDRTARIGLAAGSMVAASIAAAAVAISEGATESWAARCSD